MSTYLDASAWDSVDSPPSLSFAPSIFGTPTPPDSPITPTHPSDGFESAQIHEHYPQLYGSWSSSSDAGWSPQDFALVQPSASHSACDQDGTTPSGGVTFRGYDLTNPNLTVGELLKVVPDHPVRIPISVKVDLSPPKKTAATGMPFIQKLRSLLANPQQFGDCLVWDQEGKSFILSTASSRLLKDVLPKAFGHSNISSFNRQLNVYGFQRLPIQTLFEKIDSKAPNTASFNGWTHKDFTRDSHDWVLMTPRPSRARLAKKIVREQEKEKEKLELRKALRIGR
ncbi:hypothetical protein RQP46_005471 [Phenoliferia psychrophenolica]